MKGIVFTEFLDMVESEYGYEIVDKIIENSDLTSRGIYTSVGTYEHGEIVQLLSSLSSEVSVEAQILLKAFGKYLFGTFLGSYPHFFSTVDNVLEFLKSIDAHIHVEVLKLYPDATLPSFKYNTREDGALIMTYESERKMAALAEGLIERAIEHFDEPYQIQSEHVVKDGSVVRFIISKENDE
jgi:hypothetical protein